MSGVTDSDPTTRAGTDDRASTPEQRLFSRLRDACVKVVRVRHLLAQAQTSAPVAMNPAAVIAGLRGEGSGIDSKLASARAIVEESPELADRWSDVVTRIESLWDDVRGAGELLTAGQATGDLLLVRIDALIVEIQRMTIVPRLVHCLRDLQVGDVIDIHTVFARELPTPALRIAVLTALRESRVPLPGVIDVASGTVTAASLKRWRQLVSWGLLAAAVGAALILAGFSRTWLPDLGIGLVPEQPDRTFVVGVAAAYAGTAVHLLIAAIKQSRGTPANAEHPFVALGNWNIWVHVHEGYLLVTAVAVPIAVYVLILAQGEIVLGTLFFLGYFIDSTLDVLFARFDSAAKGQSQIISGIIQGIGLRR